MSIYNIVNTQIKKSISKFNFNPQILKILEQPMKQIHVKIPFTMNNEIQLLDGYRCQHNNFMGPFKGGIRLNESVNMDECAALSGWMTYKCALQNLPLGGGKGGICINPNNYNNEQLEIICRNFSNLLSDNIGQGKDIPAPDVGSNSIMMNWMNHELYNKTNKFANFTGKTLEYGGCEGREEATGFGVAQTLFNWAETNNYDLSNKTYTLQGFGNVGSFTSRYLNEVGMKLIAVGDHSCYIQDNEGINVFDLIDYQNKNNEIKGFSNNIITKDEFFLKKCDVLIPSALELQINEKLAKEINCKIILEAANGPLYPEADDVLKERNIDVLPDILANSGGVVVSYYEYLQNLNNNYEDKVGILNKLQVQMKNTFDNVHYLKTNNNITYRDASYATSLFNIHKKFEN